jgi:hypothetical protein
MNYFILEKAETATGQLCRQRQPAWKGRGDGWMDGVDG